MFREIITRTVFSITIFSGFSSLPATCQDRDRGNETVPIYRVTVVQRTVEAINYQYRSGPTKIGFRGTVLMSKAKGDATVESRRGRTEIDAKLENIEEPQRFGREFMTYVLWAISPEGRPHNLGEVVPGPSNSAKLRVTTDLQAFGLIVTAEPYSAVRQPSDVVVAENLVRSDTVGKIEQIHARYELMPRGQYTWQTGRSGAPAAEDAPKVSMDQYEALSHLYQSQYALGVARAAGAEQYAPNTFAKAQQMVTEAERLQKSKAKSSLVVQTAREAAQTAEDARVIAERRRQEEKLAKAQAEVSAAQQAKVAADAEAQQAKSEADAARAQAEADRAARERAEAEAAAARGRASLVPSNRAPAYPALRPQSDQSERQKIALRMRLLEQLNGVVTSRDTPRGLVVTLSEASFNGPGLRGTAPSQLARVAAIVAAHRGLRADIEGHTDSATVETLSSKRADAVRGVLLAKGLPGSAVSARGFGSARPLYSNTSATGREENRRVEIVISGDPIGDIPFWDRTYNLSKR
jgi:flagellar motor protein MotB